MADESDSAIAPKNHTYKELRRRYEISLAKAKLEFAESGDDDKLWPGINERQDERDDAIFAELGDLEPPADSRETWDLLKFIETYMEEHNQLGIQSDEVDFAAGLVRNARNGIADMRMAESRAKREGKAYVRGIDLPAGTVVDLRSVELGIRRSIDLMDCASCAAEFVAISPGCPGIKAALIEASNTLCDVMDMLGITEPEPEDDA